MEAVHPAHIHSKTTIEQMKVYAKGCGMMLSGLGTLFPLHETGPVYAAQMISEGVLIILCSDASVRYTILHISLRMRWMIQMMLTYGVSKTI